MTIRRHSAKSPLPPTAFAAGLVCLLWSSSVAGQCAGDCNGDGSVTVNEVITGVNIGLGTLPVESCPSFDTNGDGTVTINEIIAAVNVGLGLTPCGAETPTPGVGMTPTSTPQPTPTEGSEIGAHVCALGEGSKADVYVSAIPRPLTFQLSGEVSLDCGAVGADGQADCLCDVEALQPVDFPGIGFICLDRGTPCPARRIDCDGGESFGIETRGDANIGSCDGNAACLASCTERCAANDTAWLTSSCTGYCAGGEHDAETCSRDAECPGGLCNGGEPVAQRGICQCQCVDAQVGDPGPPGEMQCELPLAVIIERSAPCDGTDIAFSLGSFCAPLTTSTASSQITNANNSPGLSLPSSGPASGTGQAIECSALQNDGPGGIDLAGGAGVFSSALGDVVLVAVFECR